MIDTREELINALSVAAELEHGLMLQYLFAAFTAKKDTAEGLSAAKLELVRKWTAVIYSVAREEMAHLGNVINLLSSIGAGPHFRRPSFPQAAGRFYPFDFDLIRLSDLAMYRFIVFELPESEPPPQKPLALPSAAFSIVGEVIAPEPPVYSYVGQFYKQIREAFKTIPEKHLFIGPTGDQDVGDWGLGLAMYRIEDRVSALLALDRIVEEGEGATADRSRSHYGKFLSIRQELLLLVDEDPARHVIMNPRTREHPDSIGSGSMITNPLTKEVAELFNMLYGCLLLMLLQYYSYGGETPKQRKTLQLAMRPMMSVFIRPLAELLTHLPAYEDSSPDVAGPPFEQYSELNLGLTVASRLTFLFERLEACLEASNRLSAIHPRLMVVFSDMQILIENMKEGVL
jgi:hypothetical protein